MKGPAIGASTFQIPRISTSIRVTTRVPTGVDWAVVRTEPDRAAPSSMIEPLTAWGGSHSVTTKPSRVSNPRTTIRSRTVEPTAMGPGGVTCIESVPAPRRAVLNGSVMNANTSSIGRLTSPPHSRRMSPILHALAADRGRAEKRGKHVPEEEARNPREGPDEEDLESGPDGIAMGPAGLHHAASEQHSGRGHDRPIDRQAAAQQGVGADRRAAHGADHGKSAHQSVLRPEDRFPHVAEEARPPTLLVETNPNAIAIKRFCAEPTGRRHVGHPLPPERLRARAPHFRLSASLSEDSARAPGRVVSKGLMMDERQVIHVYGRFPPE